MPNFSAIALRFGLMSTPMILLAPAMRAPWMTLRPMPPSPKMTTLAPGSTLGVLMSAPMPRGPAAADVADFLEGRVLAHLGERDLRQHGVVGERAAAHVVMHLLVADAEAAGAVRHHALPLRGPDRRAEIGLA